MQTIKLGSKGADVELLQKYLHLIQDGVFGKLTHEAVVAYQKAHSLKADGIVGEKTWKSLLENTGNNLPSNLTKRSRRLITDIVVHCTASKEGVPLTVEQIRKEHMKPKSEGGNGWSDIGYHIVVLLDGTIANGRDVDLVGAHVSGHNSNSIGVVYVGGLGKNGKEKDTRTPKQKESLLVVLKALKKLYPNARIRGHRDFSPDKNGDGVISPCEFIKACPCFDAKKEYLNI